MIYISHVFILIFIRITANFASFASRETVEDQLRDVLERLNSSIIVENVYTEERGQFAKFKSNMTVLSAFVDIGVIPAMWNVDKKEPAIYKKWMEIFGSIENPLVFFTTEIDVENLMIKVRQGKPTLIVRFQKFSTWAFGRLAPRIAEIHSSPVYPRHYPHTFYPEYSAVTHAKFELMQITAHLNYFHSSSAAWVDVGIYRNIMQANDFRPFVLHFPPDFEENKMHFNYIRNPRQGEEMTHRYIMKYSKEFLCGCFWFGPIEILKVFTADYRNQVEIMMDEGLANCEEQVMGSMFLGSTLSKPAVEAGYYKEDEKDSCQPYCLGLKMREIGLLNGEKFMV